jgi:CheY-like chemotaxis protein
VAELCADIKQFTKLCAAGKIEKMVMKKAGRVYRLTPAGHDAWETQDAAIPAEYRRILWIIEAEAHTDVVRGLLREYPDELLDEWLEELAELDLVESTQTVLECDLDLSETSPNLGRQLVPDSEKGRLAGEARAAGAQLTSRGVYLAEARLRNRPASPKAAAQTVVLVVEDDPDQRALADLRMSMAGYSVRVADSVNALLRSLLEHGMPDVLVLDVMLDDGDGFDVLEKIRRNAMYALLPVVMLTVKSDAEDIARGLFLGADAYVTKPYSKNLLSETIRRVLKHA